MRLIDADALRKRLGMTGNSLCEGCIHDSMVCRYRNEYSLMDFCSEIDDAPTIDPVKHSRWFEGHCVRCFYDFGYGKNTSDFNYCPNCGAKMDGAAE